MGTLIVIEGMPVGRSLWPLLRQKWLVAQDLTQIIKRRKTTKHFSDEHVEPRWRRGEKVVV